MKKILTISAGSIHFFVSAVLLLLVTYFFGHKLLTGGLIGNDSANTFSFIVWLDKFYPKIPLWFPLEGSGVSFVQGYQVIPELLVVWIHRLTSLSLIQVYELLSFLSVYLSALGTYILGWTRFRSKTIGFIAAIFFLLAPVTWVWTAQAGFFASAISLAFFPPSFIFADMYAEYVFTEKTGKGKYIAFFLTVIFLSLALLMHFTTFMALFIILSLYLALYGLIRNKNILDNCRKVFFAIVPPFAVSVLLSAFWFIPFYIYNSAANWDLSEVPNPNLFPPINLNAFLSIPSTVYAVGSVWTFSFPLFVWILALFAIVISFFYSRRLIAVSLVGAFCLYGSLFLGVYIFASKISGFLASGFSPRIFWIIYNFFGPLLAAFAIVGFVHVILTLLIKPLTNKKQVYYTTAFFVRYLFVPPLSLLLAAFVIVTFRSVDAKGAQSFAHYGPVYLYPYIFTTFKKGDVYGAGLDLRDVWQRALSLSPVSRAQVVTRVGSQEETFNCVYEVDKTVADLCEKSGYVWSWQSLFDQLQPQNWPPLALGNTLFADDTSAKQKLVLASLPHEDNLRIDISPNSYGSLLEQFPLFRQDISVLNSYTFQLSLNHIFWAQSQGVFYNNNGPIIYKAPHVAKELSDYFGLHAIVLGKNDSSDKYKTPDWTIRQEKETVIITPKVTYPLFDITDKPSILVIGQQKYGAYEALFKNAVLGAVPFNSAYVVMGKGSPTDYSLDELKKFDVIVLYAYGPQSGSAAWMTLRQYVEEGGSVFVDTGWQYTVPDWQLQNAYDVLPTNNLKWKNLPTNGQYTTPLTDINVNKFAPLIWNGTSWGVSTSKSLKDWAHPILSYDGYPLVAEGNFGKGKVVWSGMNLFAHAFSNENPEEFSLEKNIFSYLLPQRTIQNFNATMQRSDPDTVIFTLQDAMPDNSEIYFREAYGPNWRAYVVHSNVRQEIALYRGGPGLLFAKLPTLNAGDRIILTYQLTPFEQFAYILSLLTLLGLIAYTIDHLFLEKKLTGRLTGHVYRLVSSHTKGVKQTIKQGTVSTLKSFWDEDS